jgi:putative transposase
MSKIVVYLHFVWTTKGRAQWLIPELEPKVYAVIVGEAQKLGCQVLAINGMPDHVHLLVQSPASAAPMRLMQKLKGVSSRVVGESLGIQGALWQEGYGVFSLSRDDVSRVQGYIENQKQRHAQKTTWATLEESDE